MELPTRSRDPSNFMMLVKPVYTHTEQHNDRQTLYVQGQNSDRNAVH